METKTIKAGFVGSGYAARFHYNALQHVMSAKVQVSGVFSATREHAVAFASERNGMKVYDSLEELIDESDVIHVCTPPVLGFESVPQRSLRRQKPQPFRHQLSDGGSLLRHF